jgi:AraC-like DNA-binding protein
MDVLFRFKSPIKLKIFFLLFVLSILVASFFSFIKTGPDEYILILMICPMVIGTSLVQILTNLYFIQHKKIANIYTISAYTIYIFLIIYVQILGYETVFPNSEKINISVDQAANRVNIPMYLDFFIELDFILFVIFCFFYIYNILFKFTYKNMYLKKIQGWTFCFFIVIFTEVLFNVLSIVFKFSNEFNTFIRITLGAFLLLIILYRPGFININGSKISFGFLFNKKEFDSQIKEVDFNFHFFTNHYYISKTADIEEFSTIMGVSKDLLFKYIYYTYTMSFDELLNKSRVEYFVEIIKDPKFKNYTVAALAMEVGFSSRQRFYQPFKKYHGGNPSDLIDILND